MRKALGAVVLAVAMTSCGAPPQPVAIEPPTPSASATAIGEPPAATAPISGDPNPRIVRCGIDDRPRSISSRERDFDGMSARNAKRAPSAADAAPPPMPMPLVAGPSASAMPAPVPMMLRTTVKVANPRATSGDLPPDFASAISNSAPPYGDCDGLAKETDEGSFDVRVSVATGGSVLSVSAVSTGELSPFGRCLLERSCQAHGSPSSAPVEALVTLKTLWNFPKARPTSKRPDGASPPVVVFENLSDAVLQVPFFTFLRTMTRQATRGCINSDSVPTGGRVRVLVTLSGTAPKFQIQSVTSEALGPGVGGPNLPCIDQALKKEKLPLAPKGFLDTHVSMVVDFDLAKDRRFYALSARYQIVDEAVAEPSR